MSAVVFPFHTEDPEVALRNIAIAAGHERVRSVLAVGAIENDTYDRLDDGIRKLRRDLQKPIEIVTQERIGTRRPGKGDGMNTGLRWFLASRLERLHFYDADITNFGPHWIEGAERAADAGFHYVRHYFPRASTDAMITWMITRPLLAIHHPESLLWRIRQPLGGELLLHRSLAEAVSEDPLVTNRSDWGIDTVLNYSAILRGDDLFEHYVPAGKAHALYGSLADIETMFVECLEAALEVGRQPSPTSIRHEVEPASSAPSEITTAVGYDLEATLSLLRRPWGPAEIEAAATLPSCLAEPILANLAHPTFRFLDDHSWFEAISEISSNYEETPGWRSLAFRLWVARVVAYTSTTALGGHAHAMRVLEEAVAGYAERSANR